MRPRLTAMPPIPLPSPVAFHTSDGPSFGHSLRRPVSLGTALRSGPRHWGQSSARVARVNDRERVTAERAASDLRTVACLFMTLSCSVHDVGRAFAGTV